MTYITNIETRNGTVLIGVSDAQIDALPMDAETHMLRDQRKQGVTTVGAYVTTEQICSAWLAHLSGVTYRYSRDRAGRKVWRKEEHET